MYRFKYMHVGLFLTQLLSCLVSGFHTGFFRKMMHAEGMGVWSPALRLLLVVSGIPKMLEISY